MWGESSDAHSERAEALPYASLLLSTAGNRSLLVMAYQTGAQGEQTIWQARDQATLVLRHGRPWRTAGFSAELLEWHPATLPTSGEYPVEVTWRDAAGREHLARGEARLACEPAKPRTLPLTTLPLARCQERIDWHDGAESRNTLWRHPDTQRLWAGEVTPWPDAEPIRWQVARPWWTE